jgi:hypothetical protein
MSNAAYKSDYAAEQGALNSERMLEEWKRKHGDDGVARIIHAEAVKFLTEPDYSGPILDMPFIGSRSDFLMDGQAWLKAHDVYDINWVDHGKDGSPTMRRKGGHVEYLVRLSDLHQFMTAALVANMYTEGQQQTWPLKIMIAKVAVSDVVNAIEGDDERLMLLMEAGL